jgi:triosephosphate isomerase
MRQMRQGLQGIRGHQAEEIVIAYEPVWAIGTGRASSGENANIVVQDYIRPVLTELFGGSLSHKIRVLYGGSVKAEIAAEYFGQPEIDGALVGGASLKTADFLGIVQAAAGR